MTRAIFPFDPPGGVNVTQTSPHVPRLRLVGAADAGDILGPGTFNSYLARVGATWTTLARSIGASAKIPADVAAQFSGEQGAWNKFFSTYENTWFPQDSTDIDWWANRAAAWDTYLRSVPGAQTGLPGPPASGEIPASSIGGGSISTGLSKAADVVPWIVVGLGLWVLLRFLPTPGNRQRA